MANEPIIGNRRGWFGDAVAAEVFQDSACIDGLVKLPECNTKTRELMNEWIKG